MTRRQQRIFAMIATVVIVSVSFWAILTAGKRNADRIHAAAAAKSGGGAPMPGVIYMTDFGEDKSASRKAP